MLEQHGSNRSAAKLLHTHTWTYIQSRTVLNPASPTGGGITSPNTCKTVKAQKIYKMHKNNITRQELQDAYTK